MSTRQDRSARSLGATVALIALALSAACSTSKPDSVVVGAVPDDYRTNHPIVIGEKQRKLDLPVGMADRGMTQTHRAALGGFLSRYDRKAAPPVTIIVPSGSANEIAASHVAGDMLRLMERHGVPSRRITTAAYRAGPDEINAPIRISFAEMRASVASQCGRWPGDLGETTQNKHYANFGCSYQNNLAAQIADPADLLGPREMTTIDAENRGEAIVRYKEKSVTERFNSASEVDY